MRDRGPFHDLTPEGDEGAFSLPARKWREIVFVGAMREDGAGVYVRDPARPLPPMRQPDLFAEGRRFRVERLPPDTPRAPDAPNPRRRDRSRVRLTPIP